MAVFRESNCRTTWRRQTCHKVQLDGGISISEKFGYQQRSTKHEAFTSILASQLHNFRGKSTVLFETRFDPIESFAVSNWAPKSCLSALSVENLKSRKDKFASANGLDAAQR